MKKSLCILICAIMIFSVLPLTAFAVSEVSNVDFSTMVESGSSVTVEMTELDPWIHIESLEWEGCAKGYTVYLESDVGYSFTSKVYSEKGDYFDRAIVIYPEDFTSDDDYVAYSTAYSDDGVTSFESSLSFVPEISGNYYVLTYGFSNDASGNVIYGEVYEDFLFFMHDYTLVDYSDTLELDVPKDYTITGDEFFIKVDGWSGYAHGFNAALDADTGYVFEVTVTGIDDCAVYTDRALALLTPDELTGDIYYDAIANNNDSSDSSSVTVLLPITTDVADNYRLLAWGWIKDEAGTQLMTSEYVHIRYLLRKKVIEKVTISNSSELVQFAQGLQNGDYDAEEVVAEIVADIDMTGVAYEAPVSSYDYVRIHGNGYTISGMTDALLRYAEYPVIEDLTLESVYAFSAEEPDEQKVYFGAFCCEASYIKLDNCTLDASLSFESYNAAYAIGGMIGYTYAAIITDCTVNADFDFSGIINVGSVGGILGYVDNGIFDGLNYEGSITLDAQTDLIECVGGVFGFLCEGTIIDCGAKADIATVEPEGEIELTVSHRAIGGLAGMLDDYVYVNACFAEGDIIAPYAENVGGFVGETDENYYYNCYSAGSVNGKNSVGGFMGDSSCCGRNLFVNCYTTCDVTGVAEVGGFIGESYYYDEFYNCYATGTVAAQSSDVGMFLGYSSSSNLIFENVFCATDIDIFECGNYEGDIGGVSVIDFSDDEAVDDMEAVFNDYVDEKNAEEFFAYKLNNWEGRNEDNGPTFEQPAQFLLGDVDGDGDIDQFDYLLVKRSYFNTYSLTEDEALRADVDCDGDVDQMDYLLIKRHYFETYVIGA